MMEIKAFTSRPENIEGRTVTGLASIFGNIDSYGDIVHPGAFRKTIQENSRRIRYLWMHDSMVPPIAVIKDLKEVGKKDVPQWVKDEHPEVTGGLMVTREYLETERASEILTAIKAGALNEQSFGFEPVKYDHSESMDYKGQIVRNLREVKLFDLSDVTWGANSLTVSSKMAVPFKDTGKADEGTEWNAPTLSDFTDQDWEELPDAEKRRIAAHYAWAESMPPANFGDLKLPHHQPAKTGIGPAVWRGVAAAMAAMMGSRGGVELPDADTGDVHKHLASHYEMWDKEPPPMKLVYLAQTVRDARDLDIKAGRVLSQRNLDRLKSALDVLAEILLAAEPPADEEAMKALTAELEARINLADRFYVVS